MANLIIETVQGKVRGKISEAPSGVQFLTFKSIPYAKPPVGKLRFSVPVPAEPWDGIRDGTKDSNICMQLDKITECIIGDEDCLYLNVYTPNLFPKILPLLPVMVLIHGGGFLFGNGTDEEFHGPDYLVEKGVIVVSFNYRLGVLGFLCLDHKDAPGNMGLRDQVQALKWIKSNIDKFGGDPENVTIFGFSAGAASVEYLLLSKMAKGLFHKAIAHSGSTLLPWAHNNDLKELAYKIPLIKSTVKHEDSELLEYLKDLPPKELVAAAMFTLPTVQHWYGGLFFGYVPTIEKKGDWEPFLDENPYELLSKGKFTKVPYISGICSREGLLMITHGERRLKMLKNEKEFTKFLPFKINDADKIAIQKKIYSTYLTGYHDYDEEDDFAIDFFSDVDFFGGSYVSAKLIANHNTPVFYFEFAYDGALNYLKKKYNTKRKGTCHGDDEGYLVKCDIDDPSETDLIVKNRMCTMWTNFATFGDPTPNVDKLITTKWEPISKSGMVYLRIDENLTMRDETQLNPDRAKLFKDLYEKYEMY